MARHVHSQQQQDKKHQDAFVNSTQPAHVNTSRIVRLKCTSQNRSHHAARVYTRIPRLAKRAYSEPAEDPAEERMMPTIKP